MNRPSDDSPYAFVCYSHQDAETIEQEVARLRRLTVHVWYDNRISPGTRWSDEIAEAISNADFFIYFVSTDSVSSPTCQDELAYALDAGVTVIAVHLEPMELPPGLKLRLMARQAIMRYELSEQAYERKLITALNKHVGTTSVAEPEPATSPSDESHEQSSFSSYFRSKSAFASLIAAALFLGFGSYAVYMQRNPDASAPLLEQAVPSEMNRQLTFSGNALYPSISPDGRWLAHTEKGAGRDTVQITELQTSKTRSLFEANTCGPSRFLPGDRHLLVAACRLIATGPLDLYLIPITGGEVRNLGRAGVWATGSPDGGTVAGAMVNWHLIRLTNIETLEVRDLQLGDAFDWIRGLDWSPDGRTIAFSTSSDSRNIHALSVIDVETSEQTQLLEISDQISSPRWSADGGAVLFARASQGSYRLNRLTVIPEPSFQELSLDVSETFDVSAAGKVVYLTQERRANLMRVPLTDPGQPPELITSGDWIDLGFDIHPISSSVYVFARSTGERSNIYMSQPDGEIKQLTFLDSRNSSPVFDPTGTRIAFGSTEGGAARVWTMDTNGQNLKALRYSNPSKAMAIIWLNDHELIYQTPGQQNYERYNLISGRRSLLFPPEIAASGWTYDPRISPDRRRIAFNRNVDGSGLWLYDLPKDELTQLAGIHDAGRVYQQLSAEPFAGRRGRVRGMIKAEIENLESGAFVWVTIDGVPGDSSSLHSQNIRSGDRQEAVVQFDVPETARTITVGIKLNGKGIAWFDSIVAEVETEDGWQGVALADGGFGHADRSSWRTLANGRYRFDRTTGDGREVAVIESLPMLELPVEPIGWSTEGDTVYALNKTNRQVWRIHPAGGEPVSLGQIDFAATEAQAPIFRLDPSATHIVYNSPMRISDVSMTRLSEITSR